MLATAVLVAQYAGTFEVLDTTRVQGRASQPAPVVNIGPPAADTGAQAQGKDVISADVSTIPMARLELRDRSWEYTLSYSPTFTAAGVELAVKPQIFQLGTASVAWHDRALHLMLSEAGSYGQFNSAFFQATSPGQSVALQPVPAFTTIDVASSITSGSAALRATPRALLLLAGGYSVTGGVTAQSQQFLPKHYGPRAAASLAYALSRRDMATTLASVLQTTTSGGCPGQGSQQATPVCEESATVSELQETFRHQLSRVANVSLGGGVAAALVKTPSVGEELVIQPTALVAFSYRFGTPRSNLGGTLAASTRGSTSGAVTGAYVDAAGVATGDSEGSRSYAASDATGRQPGSVSRGSSTSASLDTPTAAEGDARESAAAPNGRDESAGAFRDGAVGGAGTTGAADTSATAIPGLATGRMNELILTAQLSPLVDPRTGLVSERMQALATLTRQVTSSTTVRLAGSFLQSVPISVSDAYPLTAVSAGVDVQTRVDRQLAVGAGALELWQNQSGYGTLVSTVVFVTVTVRAPTLHF